jgi:D-alanyl-lipoteichoic acid acyltransferase DltB (MBOAT superfamily)
MALCGLWHGAGWTYVAWGLWHGIGLIVCRGWQALRMPLPRAAGWALTMAFVLVGWVLFRASSFDSAGAMLASLGGLNGFGGVFAEAKLIAIAALASVLVPSAHEMIEGLQRPRPALAVVTALIAAACVLEVGKGPPLNFIYFQF